MLWCRALNLEHEKTSILKHNILNQLQTIDSTFHIYPDELTENGKYFIKYLLQGIKVTSYESGSPPLDKVVTIASSFKNLLIEKQSINITNIEKVDKTKDGDGFVSYEQAKSIELDDQKCLSVYTNTEAYHFSFDTQENRDIYFNAFLWLKYIGKVLLNSNDPNYHHDLIDKIKKYIKYDDQEDGQQNNVQEHKENVSVTAPPSLSSTSLPPTLSSGAPPSLSSAAPPSLSSSGAPPSLSSAAPPSLSSSGAPPSLSSAAPPSLSSSGAPPSLSSAAPPSLSSAAPPSLSSAAPPKLTD